MNDSDSETQQPPWLLGLSRMDCGIIALVFTFLVGIAGTVPIKAATDLYKVNKHGHVVVASAPAEVSDP